MPAPPIPPALEQLGQRPFSFYPPILNIEHNEWIFQRATWSEIQVVNTKSGEEIFVSRRFVSELSRIDEPVMILGLTKELEYKFGQVLPHIRRVIEIPRAVNDSFRPGTQPSPPVSAPVVGIRLESGTESRIGRLIMIVLVGGIGMCVLLVSFFRGAGDGSRVTYTPILQSDLALTAADDYHAVVRKLGTPQQDVWRSDAGELQYRVLRYPKEKLSVILMGSERDKARYIGALDQDWRPIHSVSLPGGGNTNSMLRSIKRF